MEHIFPGGYCLRRGRSWRKRVAGQLARTLIWLAAYAVLAGCSAVPGEPGQNNATCGDGVREPIEQCEGADLGGQTCEGLGQGGGTLACSNCAFDTTGCSNCGNDVCDPGEYRSGCPTDCGVQLLATGQYHACAAMGDGSLWCWGSNHHGTIGDGTYENRATPVRVPGIEDVVGLCAGMVHSCALVADGTIWCWGENYSGMLGDGTDDESPIPVQVAGVSNGARIACGSGHTCALTDGGTVRCWGDNFDGQLGDGNMGQDSLVPVSVSGLVDVVDLALGGNFSCGVRADGSVWCWGEGGTLGNGPTEIQSSDLPVQVSYLDDVWALTQGGGASSHACAIRADGSLWCWGGNSDGKIGDGTRGGVVIAPVQVLDLADVATVGTGLHHTCASTTDGLAFCWGSMDDLIQFGQLGHGTNAGSTTAVQVVGLDRVASVSAGGAFSCAVLENGTAWCWGLNYSGELGVGGEIGVGGETRQSSVPLQVLFP